MSRNILITGYEPFGGDNFNPSLALAEALNGCQYKDFTFQYATIPVNRHLCIPTMEKAIDCYNPELIICTGLAYGRAAISIERVAINTADFPWPDNEGYLALNESIDPDGPAAYFSSLPIRSIMLALHKNSIPAYISNSAGTYCCNLLMYGTLNYIAKHHLPIRAGMMHVPYTPDITIAKDPSVPSMSLDLMIRAVRTAAVTTAETTEDASVIFGFAQ